MKQIMIDFFAANVRKIFWGIMLFITLMVMWYFLDMLPEVKTLMVATAGFILTQFKSTPQGEGKPIDKPPDDGPTELDPTLKDKARVG